MTTVAAVQGMGNLLLFALIVAPAAAALRLGRRLRSVLPLAVALTALSGVGGLLLSFHLRIAAGAAVALCALVPAFAAMAMPARRG
jgi:ABC-type Mn2+/Zn2+ transport system permease subunit